MHDTYVDDTSAWRAPHFQSLEYRATPVGVRAELLLLLGMMLLFIQACCLKPLIAWLGETGVLVLATTACLAYDWSLAAASVWHATPAAAFLICGSLAMLGEPDALLCVIYGLFPYNR